MGCNGGRELTFLKWEVVRAAPLNPTDYEVLGLASDVCHFFGFFLVTS